MFCRFFGGISRFQLTVSSLVLQFSNTLSLQNIQYHRLDPMDRLCTVENLQHISCVQYGKYTGSLLICTAVQVHINIKLFTRT